MERHRISFNKSMEGSHNSFIKKLESEDNKSDKSMSSELEAKVKKSFIKLNKILNAKKLSLYATYNAYDTDRNGKLTLGEF